MALGLVSADLADSDGGMLPLVHVCSHEQKETDEIYSIPWNVAVHIPHAAAVSRKQ